MLEAAWENHATTLANAPTADAFIEVVENLIKLAKIDLTKPANIVYARDTRPTGPTLVAAFEDGLKASGAVGRNEGIKSTPVLHYLVRCINSKGTAEAYGEDSEDGYMRKLSGAFKKLVVCGTHFSDLSCSQNNRSSGREEDSWTIDRGLRQRRRGTNSETLGAILRRFFAPSARKYLRQH